MKVVVTGGSGYLGVELVKYLIEKGFDITVVDSLIYGNFLDKKIKLIKEDIRSLSYNSILTLKNSDVIIHLAAIVGDPACDLIKEEAVDINLNGTKKIVDICKKYKKKLIYASTCSVYGANDKLLNENSKVLPLSIYALSKLAAENYIEKAKVNCTIFRMGTIFGFSDRMRFDLVINRFVADAIKKGKVKVFGGGQWRPFLYIKDAVRFYYRCLEEGCPPGIFNLASFNIEISDLAKKIKKITGCKIERIKEIADPRNYKVSTKRAESIFRIKSTIKSLEYGINEIKSAVESGVVINPDLPVYSNVEYLRELRKK
jgi:nucleoside-diphosphate-sugar epimerase